MASVLQHNRRGSLAARAIRTLGGGFLAGLCLVSMQAALAGRSEPIQTQAPVHVIARGFEQPTGLAVHPHGFLVLTDRETGVLYRLSPAADGTFSSGVLLAGLKEPHGVVVEHDGHLLIAEKDRGQVVRVAKLTEEAFSAVPEPVMTGLKDPRWLALDAEGAILVSAEGIKKEKLPKRTPKPQDEVVLRIAPDGALHVVADEFEELSGLALDHAGHLFAGATRRRDDKEKRGERIVKIELPDGPVSPVLAGGFNLPRDLDFDVLGALFFTAKEFRAERGSGERDKDDREETRSSGGRQTDGRDKDDHEDRDEDERSQTNGVILKATFKPDGSLQTLTPFAFRLGSPEGLAFDRDGHLYVADSKHGRVLRFQAPAPPMLEPFPLFTRQSLVTVKGSAARNATLTILGGTSPAIGLADPHTGAFAVEVSLLPNTEQTLLVYATGSRGDGLTSAPAQVIITHDDVPPDTEISGSSGQIPSPSATFTFSGTDNLTPPAQLRFSHSLDGAPFTSFTPTTTLTLTNLASGFHSLLVKAQDLAENDDPTPAEQTFTVTGLSLTITSPADGATINADRIFVKGTVTGANTEVGVSVNGVLAFVAGTEWVAEVPLTPGPNFLTVIATDNAGSQVNTSMNLTVSQVASVPVLLRASPDSAVAPLVVTWQVLNQTGRPLVRFELDEAGSGSFGTPTTALDGTRTTYANAGLHFPTLRATDDQGVVYTATTIVNVEGPQAVTARFQNQWASLKDRLLAGDLPGALAHFSPDVQSRFRAVFQQLGPDLPAIAEGLGPLEVVEQMGDLAEAVLVQQENGVPVLHFIYFRRDSLGRWLLEEM